MAETNTLFQVFRIIIPVHSILKFTNWKFRYSMPSHYVSSQQLEVNEDELIGRRKREGEIVEDGLRLRKIREMETNQLAMDSEQVKVIDERRRCRDST